MTLSSDVLQTLNERYAQAGEGRMVRKLGEDKLGTVHSFLMRSGKLCLKALYRDEMFRYISQDEFGDYVLDVSTPERQL